MGGVKRRVFLSKITPLVHVNIPYLQLIWMQCQIDSMDIPFHCLSGRHHIHSIDLVVVVCISNLTTQFTFGGGWGHLTVYILYGFKKHSW